MQRSISSSLWILFSLLVFLFVVSPTAVTAYYSFGTSKYFQFPIETYSVKWYGAFFSSDKFRDAMVRTGILAAAVTPICLLAALATAHAMSYGSKRAKQLLDAVALSPLIVPGVVTGIAFLSFFRLIGLESGLARMTIAMLVVC